MMGTSYFANLGVGFVFARDDVLVLFEHVVPEISHMEDRYDSKTGKKVAQVKVITQDEDVSFVFDGKTFSSEEDGKFLDAFAKKAKCRWETFGAASEGGPEFIIFYPPRMPAQRGEYAYDNGMNAIGGEYDVATIIKLVRPLALLRKRLIKMGLRPKKAEVLITYGVG